MKRTLILASVTVLLLMGILAGFRTMRDSDGTARSTGLVEATNTVIKNPELRPGGITETSSMRSRQSSSGESAESEKMGMEVRTSSRASAIPSPSVAGSNVPESSVLRTKRATPEQDVFDTNEPIPAGLEIEIPLSTGQRIVVEIPPDAHLPAAVIDQRGHDSPVVAKARDTLIEDFAKEIQAAVTDPAISSNESALSEAYDKATETADQQYRALFGEAAFNNYKLKTATEALKYRVVERKTGTETLQP